MTTIALTLLTISALLTSVISAVCGMGGGIVLLSIMTFFLPLPIIVPIHGIVQLISNLTRSFFLRRSIILKIPLFFTLGLPFGACLAIVIIKRMGSTNIPLLLIVGLIFYTLFKPKRLPPLKIPLWCFVFVGFVVGVLSPLIGATGPFIAPFFIRDDFSKENIIASKSSVQLLGHILKIPTFLYLGFDYLGQLKVIILLTVAAIVGTRLGVLILGRVSEGLFRKIYKTALFLAAIRILYKVFF